MNKVFLWARGVDSVLLGEPKVAGVPLQMSMWAKAFQKNNWVVSSIATHTDSYEVNGVHFVQAPQCSSKWRKLHLSFIGDTIATYSFLKKQKPDMVFLRSMTRELLTLAVCAKILRFKYVFFGASDHDFLPNKESKWNFNHGLERYYRFSLRFVKYIVTQNEFQAKKLKENWGRDSIIIPNIWYAGSSESLTKKYDVIWVGNLRKLKRAEWFLNLARRLPQSRFAIVGGVSEQDYYNKIRLEASSISNLDFKGACNLHETNSLISKSRLLACTSEFEGFPNTFLQAWSYNVPVVSTVDPSEVIKTYNLGIVIDTEEGFINAVNKISKECSLYEDIVESINDYFMNHHSADSQKERLMSWINEQS